MNRGSLAKNSAIIQPKDHMSTAVEYCLHPNRSSGALEMEQPFVRKHQAANYIELALQVKDLNILPVPKCHNHVSICFKWASILSRQAKITNF